MSKEEKLSEEDLQKLVEYFKLLAEIEQKSQE